MIEQSVQRMCHRCQAELTIGEIIHGHLPKYAVIFDLSFFTCGFFDFLAAALPVFSCISRQNKL